MRTETEWVDLMSICPLQTSGAENPDTYLMRVALWLGKCSVIARDYLEPEIERLANAGLVEYGDVDKMKRYMGAARYLMEGVAWEKGWIVS